MRRLVTQKTVLETRLQQVGELRQRAIQAAQQAELEIVQIQAQIALLDDLLKPQPNLKLLKKDNG